MRKKTMLCALPAVLLGACTTPMVTGGPAVTVTASGETEPVGTANHDAADDPAIWHNAADPAASLIVATDKKAGLYVYGLDGNIRSFFDGGRVNNVDLAELDDGRVIVVASDRNDPAAARLQVLELDTGTGTLQRLGTVEGGTGEGYGLCVWNTPQGLHAYSVLKEGVIEEYRLDIDTGVSANLIVSRRVPSQPEGCVVDPRDGTLYVGAETAGIWRFARGEATGEIVAPIDNDALVADVEGLAIAPEGEDGGYLVASSQGDNAFAVYALPAMDVVGRFRIEAGAFGATEETDGIELVTKNFGADYPQGLFVAQDGQNEARAQNFKLVSWAAIRAALGID